MWILGICLRHGLTVGFLCCGHQLVQPRRNSGKNHRLRGSTCHRQLGGFAPSFTARRPAVLRVLLPHHAG